jgi:hypothetical protein
MPQIFPKWSNTALRVAPVAFVLLCCAAVAVGMVVVRSPYKTREDIPREQPVPFSHQHHVADAGIDCRYCHTSVEESRFAGVPPTKVCMNCHRFLWRDAEMLAPVRESWRTGEPLKWNRVHDVPDYVYFDHSVHVAKGVGCVECHGRIDQMPLVWQEHSLQMRWCLDCHRDPTPHLRPNELITAMGTLDELKDDPGYRAAARRLFPDRDPGGVTPDETRGRVSEENDVHSLTNCYTCHR